MSELFCTLIFLGVETLERCLAMTELILSTLLSEVMVITESQRMLYTLLWKIRQWLCARASGKPVPVLAERPAFDAEACLHDASPLAVWLGLKQVCCCTHCVLLAAWMLSICSGICRQQTRAAR